MQHVSPTRPVTDCRFKEGEDQGAHRRKHLGKLSKYLHRFSSISSLSVHLGLIFEANPVKITSDSICTEDSMGVLRASQSYNVMVIQRRLHFGRKYSQMKAFLSDQSGFYAKWRLSRYTPHYWRQNKHCCAYVPATYDAIVGQPIPSMKVIADRFFDTELTCKWQDHD